MVILLVATGCVGSVGDDADAADAPDQDAASSELTGDTNLLPMGATWRYLEGSAPAGWQGTTFVDTAWKAGKGELGFGDSDEATVISAGNPRRVAFYFRTTFQVPNASSYTNVRLRFVRDDGAVFYLNGAEITRSNMPSGTITSTTLSASVIGVRSDEQKIWEVTIPATSLRTGTNLLAAEVHQSSASSSDVSFNASIVATASKCAIGGITYENGTVNSANPCQLCSPLTNPVGWSAAAAGVACNDGSYCTVSDICNGSGTCTGSPRSCADSLSCTAESCNEAKDTCEVVISAGCVISNSCVASGVKNMANACEQCDPTRSTTGWSAIDGCNSAPACGDKVCSAGESCGSCASDCGACPTGTYSVGALSTTNYAIPAGALFVATNGNDANTGTIDKPIATLQSALDRVAAGGTIVFRAGTYHQSGKTKRSVVVQSYPGERVIFDGARPVTGFVQSGSAWVASGWTLDLGHVTGSAVTTAYAGYPGQVWLDGAELREVGSVGEVTAGTFFLDEANDKVYVGTNPTGKLVEASDLSVGFETSGQSGIGLKGVTFRRFATKKDQTGVVRVFSSQVLIENVLVEYGSYSGIFVGGRNPGVVIRNSTFRKNGALGVTAWEADGLQVLDSVMEGNNTLGWNVSWEAGGFKNTQSRDVTVQGCLIRNNLGNGYWLDQAAQNLRFIRNTVVDNQRSGVMLELSARLYLWGNTIARNGRYGVYLNDSNDTRIQNNVIVDNSTDVMLLSDETRSLPATDVASDADTRPGEVWPNGIVLWETRNITMTNNIIGDYATSEAWSSDALLNWNANQSKTSYENMNLIFDGNAYWRRSTSSTASFARLTKGASTISSATFAAYRTNTPTFDVHGRAQDGGSNIYLSGTGMGLRSTITSGGAAVPSDTAAAVGITYPSSLVGVPPNVAVPVVAP